MGDANKILDGLAHCLPETDVDAMMSCSTCPYEKACKSENESVRLPIELVEDMRAYIKQSMGKTLFM